MNNTFVYSCYLNSFMIVPITAAPIFLSTPDFVIGMPVALVNCLLIFVTPSALLHEKLTPGIFVLVIHVPPSLFVFSSSFPFKMNTIYCLYLFLCPYDGKKINSLCYFFLFFSDSWYNAHIPFYNSCREPPRSRQVYGTLRCRLSSQRKTSPPCCPSVLEGIYLRDASPCCRYSFSSCSRVLGFTYFDCSNDSALVPIV